MQDPTELKRQLESMERELYRIHCQRERLSSPRQLGVRSKVSPVARHVGDARHIGDGSKGRSLPPLTRDQFMALQRRAPSTRQRSPPHPLLAENEAPSLEESPHWGFVNELISHPSSHKPSRPVTRPTSRDETDTSQEPSFPTIYHRGQVMPKAVIRPAVSPGRRLRMESQWSPASQIDYCEEDEFDSLCSDPDKYDVRPPSRRTEADLIRAFEKKLTAEKDYLQNEFDQIVEKMQQEKEDLKRRRDQDREKFYSREEQFDKELAEAKLDVHRANDQLRRTQQELTTQRLKYEDAARDLEHLQKDILKAESKHSKLQDRSMELQNTLSSVRSENEELKSKVTELDREARRLARDSTTHEAQTQKLMSQVASLTDENQKVKVEYSQLKEELRRVQTELDSIQLERDRDSSSIIDLKAQLQRLSMEKQSAERVSKTLEERLSEAESQYRREKAEREKAQRTSLDLSNRQAEAVKNKVRLDEVTVESERLIAELRNVRHENEKLSECRDRLEHEKSMLTNGKLLAEQEAHKLRKELREVRVGTQISRVAPKCKKIEDLELIDNECNPISKRGLTNKAKSPLHRRPFWWHEEPGAKETPPPASRFEGPRSAPLEDVRCREFDFVRKVIPVPRRHNSMVDQKFGDSRLELLQAEKSEVENSLQKIPRNPAFRTSDESDEYAKLQKRLECIEQDIEKIRIAI
eukprot:Gregarina_sp_Poly_1__252@NODE_105_length_14330_cov_232_248545_g92_i0_p2_GENE_NODE_105_length_14330_cov_232_248545_g92_i0NODE_105_length_14330_cov_232_248545_g92_i0_p2_ORF_typecomplete_len696_score155_52KASH_CCD/PF14662_6/7_1e02KASH_CCD/PF14662_6/3_3e02KASH_CCD/PF14662_6/3_8e06KASH_CCD/PF14662_6/1_5e02KASH_CCD/PF14662_6/4_9e02WEMBL/PF05701_11/0_0023WEMBL/PF05701_11/0_00086WEMBL/PF05701_11/1_4e02WEMBL/PF05701_11/7_3e02ATG16/PF08614_11/3_2e03ATG16/PF08614_11/0_39ATG16/PF08614_11/0_00047ATG16/PF0861